MSKALAIIITISALILLILPLSQIITKGREIIIENISADESSLSQPLILSSIDKDKKIKKDERINAIFLGLAGNENNAPNLTDTLIIVSFNQKNNQGFLLSIPRDLLVRIPGSNYYTKINAIYQERGMDAVQDVLKEITNLNFDYEIVISLEGVKKMIDQLGGIDVFVKNDIYDPAFPGPNNSYQLFSLKKGLHHLDGQTVLKYIRTRHDFNGDFARMARQQQVLMVFKEKISSLHPLWNINIIIELWRTLKNNFESNLTLSNIKTFWQMVKNIDSEKIDFKILDSTTELLISGHVTLGGTKAYILKPKKGIGDYSEIRKYINNLVAQD